MNYKEPQDASVPDKPLVLEVLKSGTIISNLEFLQSKISFGRLEENDVVLDHQSSSRYHCVLQYCGGEWNIYDLGSVHGTFLNKKRLESSTFVKLYSGDLVKFGASSRLYIIHGATEREFTTLMFKPVHTVPLVQKLDVKEEEEEVELTLNGKPIPPAVFYKDPKGVLSTWFEQQGYELNIEYEETEQGFMGNIQMPVEFLNFVASATAAKKKEVEKEVCLQACRKLSEKGLLVDSEGVLTEAEKRKIRNQMFGDSDNDDDLIYDKTVKKRKNTKNINKKSETFESLSEKRLGLLKELEEISKNLENVSSNTMVVDEEDSLDAFMSNIESQSMHKSKAEIEKRLPSLKHELEKIEKLLEIVRPSSLLSSQSNPIKQISIKEIHKNIDTGSSGFKMPMPVKSPQKSLTQESDSSKKSEEMDELETKQARQYGAMTLDQSAKHFAIETEDVEAAPDLDYKKKNEIEGQNAAYGY